MKKDGLDRNMGWFMRADGSPPQPFRAFRVLIDSTCNVAHENDYDTAMKRMTEIQQEFNNFVNSLCGSRDRKTIPTVREMRVIMLKLFELCETELQIEE